MKKKYYEVEIGSPPDFEELVAYIYLSDKSSKEIMEKSKVRQLGEGESYIEYVESEEIATITKEEGPDKMKVRFSEYAANNDLDLNEVIKAIDKAKKALLE